VSRARTKKEEQKIMVKARQDEPMSMQLTTMMMTQMVGGMMSREMATQTTQRGESNLVLRLHTKKETMTLTLMMKSPKLIQKKVLMPRLPKLEQHERGRA
jgi:cystathionine beta-lyase/cystathionine gamma-synthase